MLHSPGMSPVVQLEYKGTVPTCYIHPWGIGAEIVVYPNSYMNAALIEVEYHVVQLSEYE